MPSQVWVRVSLVRFPDPHSCHVMTRVSPNDGAQFIFVVFVVVLTKRCPLWCRPPVWVWVSPNDDASGRHCSSSDGLIHSTDTLMAKLMEHLRNTSICSVHPLHWSSSWFSVGLFGAIGQRRHLEIQYIMLQSLRFEWLEKSSTLPILCTRSLGALRAACFWIVV